MSRAAHSVRNLIYAYAGQGASQIIRFLVRTVMIATLAKEYLGLGGLFTNLLSLLSLAELGIGTAINFSLYEPIATGDRSRILSLMSLYRRAYLLIGGVILSVGCVLTPFLSFFMKEIPDIAHIRMIYLLYVLDSGLSYFFSYRAAFINANQQGYIVTNAYNLRNVVTGLIQIAVLLIFRNYLIYLSVQVVMTVLVNAALSEKAKRMYPFLKETNHERMDNETKGTVRKNVRALIFHRIGSVIVFSTDNVLLSKLFGLAMVGMYTNYTAILGAVEVLIFLFTGAITASVGNLRVEADETRQSAVFYEVLFCNFFLAFVCAVTLGASFQPFIVVWAGEEYLMSAGCAFFIVLNFFLKSIRQTVLTFDLSYGLMEYYQYVPLVESLMNLAGSMLLARIFGPVGIFMGTTLSTLAAPIWIEPLVLFRHGLRSGAGRYFKRLLLYGLLGTAAIGGAMACSIHLMPMPSYLAIGLIPLSFAVSAGLLWLLFCQTKEFQQVKARALGMLRERLRGGRR